MSGCEDEKQCPVQKIKYSDEAKKITIGGSFDLVSQINAFLEDISYGLGEASIERLNEISTKGEVVKTLKVNYSNKFHERYSAVREQICSCYKFAQDDDIGEERKNKLLDNAIDLSTRMYSVVLDYKEPHRVPVPPTVPVQPTVPVVEAQPEQKTENQVKVLKKVPVIVRSKDVGSGYDSFDVVLNHLTGKIEAKNIVDYMSLHPKGTILEFIVGGKVVKTENVR
jgi:hypothetical protein